MDDFSDLLTEKYDVNVELPKFKLEELILCFHYFKDGDAKVGSPITTSLRLYPIYNIDILEDEWYIETVHSYQGSDEPLKDLKQVKDLNIIEKIERIDLRRLKNNYFSNESRLGYWSIEYNHMFKIVGPINNTAIEYDELSKILDFEKIKEEFIKKTKELKG